MRFAVFALACALLLLFHSVDVNAFTAGFLLPAYICGPPTDGLPKSLATYLPYVQRATAATGSTTTTPRLDYPLDAGAGGSIDNTRLVLANWHNRNSVYGCNTTIFVNTSLVAKPAVVNQIVPGQLHTITLLINAKFNAATGTSQCDFYKTAGAVTTLDLNSVALDGAVVYAQNATGTRVGNFTAFGVNSNGVTTMQPWAACGPLNTGIVHNQLIDNNVGFYSGIQWQAPATITPGSTITFKGAAVSDGGYGKHTTDIPIVTAASVGIALPVAKPQVSAIVEFNQQLVVFFVDNAKNAPAANAQVIPTSFLVTATFGTASTSANVTASPATLAIPGAMRGQTISVTCTAANAQVLSIPITSAAVTIPVKAVAVVDKVADILTVNSLCPADQVNQRILFQQEPDNDNQCIFQATTLANFATGTNTASAAYQTAPAVSLFVILAVAVAALMRKN